MPYLPEVGKLLKSDRRREWRALKSKHSKAIAASKLNFEAKFGPRLDEYQAVIDGVAKLFAKEQVKSAAIQKVVKAAGPVHNIAETYRDQVKTKVAEPARKELSAFLDAIVHDAESWISVEEMFGKRAAQPSAQALKQAEALVGALDLLWGELENLQTNLPHFVRDLKKLPDEADYDLYKSPAGKVPEAQFKKYLAAKCTEMAQAAGALGTATKRVMPHVEAMRTAGHDRGGQFNVAAFVDRLKKFAQSPDLKGCRDQAQTFANLLASNDFNEAALGFPSKRRPVVITRSAMSAKGMVALTDELVKTVQAAR